MRKRNGDALGQASVEATFKLLIALLGINGNDAHNLPYGMAGHDMTLCVKRETRVA